MNVSKEIYDYRQVIFSLVHKDLRGRYKASVLDFLWTFINLLLHLGVYILQAFMDTYQNVAKQVEAMLDKSDILKDEIAARKGEGEL